MIKELNLLTDLCVSARVFYTGYRYLLGTSSSYRDQRLVLIRQKVIFEVQIKNVMCFHAIVLPFFPLFFQSQVKPCCGGTSNPLGSPLRVVTVLGNRSMISMDKIHKGIKKTKMLIVFTKCCEYFA